MSIVLYYVLTADEITPTGRYGNVVRIVTGGIFLTVLFGICFPYRLVFFAVHGT